MASPEAVTGSQQWIVGAKIGGGGFGNVYTCKPLHDDPSCEYVVKLVPKAPGADRESLFQAVEGGRNIVPVIDKGDADDWLFLVMPRAKNSLYDCIQTNGRLSIAEGLATLADVLGALHSLANRVVHRDLKPANILWLDGTWCLSDFGISRYAEASTSPETRKFSFTPAYAAPEQWRHEHATHATDIYALGITAYEMFSGALPFLGSSEHELRQQHLHENPPLLDCGNSSISTLVLQCLLKAQEARPRAADLLRWVRLLQNDSPSGIP
jgi:serine/threonine-protein kinase